MGFCVNEQKEIIYTNQRWTLLFLLNTKEGIGLTYKVDCTFLIKEKTLSCISL